MTREIPVTQARDELADLVNRVAYGHERIILTRHSKPVACIVPPEDLAWLEQRGQERINLTSTGPAVDERHLSVTPGPLPIAAQHRPQSSRSSAPGRPSAPGGRRPITDTRG
ncbi:MAG TPA: type II toxin-antitoxin system Phd/YefM family antitoxin [Streptosporangiaceae bacterium]|nr:type II toxin-antitoxin system Phd/YefM family antitoxin [Streptosporangiaceae bacterium]